jgi:hypothetical protein
MLRGGDRKRNIQNIVQFLDKARGLRLRGFPKGCDEGTKGETLYVWRGRVVPSRIWIHGAWLQKVINRNPSSMQAEHFVVMLCCITCEYILLESCDQYDFKANVRLN